MEFEGEDQRTTISGLVRTLSGSLDLLGEGDRGGQGSAPGDESGRRSLSEDVSTNGDSQSTDGL